MVFVNNQKYACESCIKGHRSSSCNHTDRPLFEIKRKGRPASQCDKCRELRKTKRAHNKCTCESASCASASSVSVDTKPAVQGPLKSTGRFKAIAPALPNGLKDMYNGVGEPFVTTTTRQVSTNFIMYEPSLSSHVAKLGSHVTAHGCQCNGDDCRCPPVQSSDAVPTSSSFREKSHSASHNGLLTLAQAAAFCCQQSEVAVVQSDSAAAQEQPHENAKRARGTLAKRTPSPTVLPDHKRPKCSSRFADPSPAIAPEHSNTKDHPHVLYSSQNSSLFTPGPRMQAPTSHPIPSLSLTTKVVSAGCCCTDQCACPGCLEHRGPEHASEDFNDCADGCGTCVDYAGGVELPAAGCSDTDVHAVSSSVDRFFASAPVFPILSGVAAPAYVVHAHMGKGKERAVEPPWSDAAGHREVHYTDHAGRAECSTSESSTHPTDTCCGGSVHPASPSS